MQDDRRTTSAAHAVVRLFRLVNRATNRAVADLDVSGEQAHVLLVLWETGPVTIGVLQRELALSSATLTGALDRMEKAELVRRVPSPTDGRVSLIEACVGKARQKKIAAAVDTNEVACFAALSAAERNELVRLMNKCITAIDPEANRPI
jgi:DNA-binding MarR family transcriptional regulator